MKRFCLVFVLTLFLSGCGDADEGYYLIKNIDVIFDEDEGIEDFKELIAKKIKGEKDYMYFFLTPDEASYFTGVKPEKTAIKDNRLEIGHDMLTLKNTFSGVKLVGDKKRICGFYNCIITFELDKVKQNDKRLLDIQNKFKESEIKKQKLYAAQKEKLAELVFKDFFGQLTYLDDFSIKLEPIESGSLNEINSGIYFRNMGGLRIDLESKDNTIYNFKNQNSQLIGELFIIKSLKDKFDYSSWLEIQDEILYQDKQGAIYYNMHGELEAVYYQYDEKSQHYFIGLANAPKLETIKKAYIMLRTMDEQYRGEIANIQDVSLSQTDFEKKYGIKISDSFDSQEIHKVLIKKMNDKLADTKDFSKDKDWFNSILVRFPSESFSSKIYFYFHPKPMKKVISEFKNKYPRGKWIENVFVYNISPSSESGYSYFINHNGMVYEIFVATDIHSTVERMAFLSVLRHLDPTKLQGYSPSKLRP
ncbi:hypothetical protein PSI22_12315 [Xenorhabdus sp. XENO-7]|uniref:Lipoprotein n=1 Tax=Xenorhabdus aichiensis TaxID=3025874 RepID=A0ABT5M3Y3_9GAMM|nr:hypothetical protein [Xenorhabdus aichiensis]MDC9622398.1 hypothetical protein [Xenorhabdus aichiensis]